MKTFKDWIEYYNNLDVEPGLEALTKMRNFYAGKGIDIMKDAVSIPGVSLHYLLKGAIERNAELYSPKRRSLPYVERSCCWRAKSWYSQGTTKLVKQE